jgi:glycosyltransferase involved in cell wall biosynthesis
MLFSVLMANYNNSRYLDNSIKSVLDQTYTNWEIVLVDDGSTDEFETVVEKYEDDNRVKVFRLGQNKGCGYAKAFCAEKAVGDVLAFLDVDDQLVPEALEIMVAAHIENPGCSIIHSTHFLCNEHLEIIRINTSPKPLPANTPYLFLSDASIHHFATFKKLAYNKTKGLDPVREKDRAGDQELYYLLEEQGAVLFINQPLYYYRIHPGSISNWGNEVVTNNQHNAIIEESCLRRIKELRRSRPGDAAYWIKKYKTRYYKVRILNSFRRRQWIPFFSSLLVFPFVGGMGNIISYFRKLPNQGFPLLKRTFSSSYRILND